MQCFGSFPYKIQCTPIPNQVAGRKRATLTITDNASPTNQVISLAGSNPGQFALATTSTCLNAAGVTVAAGTSCTVDVQYKPTAAAVAGTTYTASVVFNVNTAVKPSVTLTGIPIAAPQVYYIHSDHLDSPRSITNTAGQEVWRWDNTDPFGNNIANENPANLGAFTFNLRFPGQYFDRETGLHYNANRDYNPAIGRYIQSVPIGLQGGINTFGYVGGNPLGFVDPSGLDRQATGPAFIFTDMTRGVTYFYDPQNPSTFTELPTRSAVTRGAHARGADTPYYGEVTFCQRGRLGRAFGTAKVRTTDPRYRWIHGGGTGLPDPYAPRQGWKPTQGCTRAQNEDVETLCDLIDNYKREHPDMSIIYSRYYK